MPKVSIIVPVYNVEQYICSCLESIINQKFSDIEIILVDDGSKDRSGIICDEYARKDARIKVIHKKNGGLSDARNVGLKVATSEFIGFIDSDDQIDLDFYQKLYMAIKKDNSDIAVASIQHFSGEKLLYLRAVDECKSLSKYDAMKELLISQRISNSVCNKLFSRKLFEGILFPVGKLYEDEYVTYKVFDKARNVSILNNTCYYYRYNIESITHAKFTEREFDRIYASLEKIVFCQINYPKLEKYARCYLVYDCISALSKMKHYDKKYNTLIRENIRKNIIIYLKGLNSITSKAFAILSAVSPSLAVFCLKLMKHHE